MMECKKSKIQQLIFSICLFIAIPDCLAQFSNQHVYHITLLNGNPDTLVNIGNVSAQFNFDSVGVNWNMKSENDYLRFKILHFYILNGRKEGEHWKKKYNEGITLLNQSFDKDMERYLKKRKIKISTAFANTPVKLIVSFIDKSTNVQGESYVAFFRFVDVQTEKTIALFHIEEDVQKMKEWDVARPREMQMRDLSFMMARYFKKYLKA